MIKVSNHKINKYSLPELLLAIAFVIFYFIDGFYKISMELGHDIRIGPIVKGAFILLALFYAILNLDKFKLNILMGVFLLFVFFVIGQYTLKFYTGENIHFSSNFNRFFKYQFIFFLFFLGVDIIRKTSNMNMLMRAYKSIIIINSILIIVGFIFDIGFLKTYGGPWRFGYDGLIFSQNEASFLFIFALTLFYYRRFHLQIKEWIFWLVLITSLMVGTKAVYLYILLLLGYHIFTFYNLKKILISGVSLVIFFYFLFFSIVNKIVLNAWETFSYFHHKYGLLYALTSGRNTFIEQKLLPLITQKWTFLNYFFGGQDVFRYYNEMGLLDLFLFFGPIGLLLYLYIFIKIYNHSNLIYNFKLYFFLVLMLIISTAGHFFESSIASLHFVFFVILTNSYFYKKKHEE